MLKIPRDLSVTLSRILTWVFMALLIFLAVVMVPLSDMLIDLPDNIGARNEVARSFDTSRVIYSMIKERENTATPGTSSASVIQWPFV